MGRIHNIDVDIVSLHDQTVTKGDGSLNIVAIGPGTLAMFQTADAMRRGSAGCSTSHGEAAAGAHHLESTSFWFDLGGRDPDIACAQWGSQSSKRWTELEACKNIETLNCWDGPVLCCSISKEFMSKLGNHISQTGIVSPSLVASAFILVRTPGLHVKLVRKCRRTWKLGLADTQEISHFYGVHHLTSK